jgi:3'-phosphoadenosine 5'-phosphosulfate sulfotransferase
MKTDITIVYQKIIDERRYKISYRKAIYANAHGDIAQLKNDLKNSIFHVFGNHQKCTVRMCDKVGNLARDRTAVLTETGANHHLYAAIHNVLVKRAEWH